MQPQNRPRVLLIAEAANSEWPSVPLVGWSHSRAIAKLTDSHVVTQSYNRKAFLQGGCVEGKDFTGIDTSLIEKPIYHLSSLRQSLSVVLYRTKELICSSKQRHH